MGFPSLVFSERERWSQAPVTIKLAVSVAPVPASHGLQRMAHPQVSRVVFALELLASPRIEHGSLAGAEGNVELVERQEAAIQKCRVHGMIPLVLFKNTEGRAL